MAESIRRTAGRGMRAGFAGEGGAGDDQRRPIVRQIERARDGRAQKRALADEWVELLGRCVVGDGPETRACAAAQDRSPNGWHD